MSHYTTVCHTTLQCVTLHYSMSHYTTVCHTTPQYVTLHYSMSHYTTICHTTLQYVTLHYSMSHYTTQDYLDFDLHLSSSSDSRYASVITTATELSTPNLPPTPNHPSTQTFLGSHPLHKPSSPHQASALTPQTAFSYSLSDPTSAEASSFEAYPESPV